MTDVTNSDAGRLVDAAAQEILDRTNLDDVTWQQAQRIGSAFVARTLESLYSASVWRETDRIGQTLDDMATMTRRDVLALLADVERLEGGE